MALDAINGNSIAFKQSVRPNLKTSQNFTSKPDEVDEEKSNASKYMIGATALAAVIGLGIAGYKGKLGKTVQEFLGGAEKAVEKDASNAGNEAQKVGKDGTKVNPDIKPTAEMEPQAKPKPEPTVNTEPEVTAKAEAEAKAKAEAKAEAEAEAAFIKKHEQVAIDKLYNEGMNVFQKAKKKYNGLIIKYGHLQSRFDRLKGVRKEIQGGHIVEQKINAKNTTLTYYSKDGQHIDKIVCNRNGKQAYQVTYRDQGNSVTLKAGDLEVRGNRNIGVCQVNNRDTGSDGKRVQLVISDFGDKFSVSKSYSIEEDFVHLNVQGTRSDCRKIEYIELSTDEHSLRSYLGLDKDSD